MTKRFHPAKKASLRNKCLRRLKRSAMIYEIKILRGAVKQLESLPLKDYEAVKSKIMRLAENPRPRGCEKLKKQAWLSGFSPVSKGSQI